MKRAYFTMLSILLAIGVCIVVSFGWFTNTEFIEPDLSGYSISAYFAGGDGSSSDPFQIKTPRHLYNLAWLQYLGYFNKKGSGNQPNESNTDTMTQYCFVIEQDLNMDGWPLPPIGTTYRPFIGILNGKGHVIENLLTSNIFSDFENDATDMHKHPSKIDSSAKYINAEVIGFIGVIGKTSDTGINTIDTSENAMPMELNQGLTVEPTVTNITLLNNEVKSNTNNVLIGSVAGYVNGTVSNVGVKGSTLNVSSRAVVKSINEKIKNLSDYSVVGYAEDAYTTATTKNNTTIYNPTTTYDHFTYYGMGNSDNWGGSLDMSSLYTRINAKINGQALSTYTNGEIEYQNADGTKWKDSVTTTTSASNYYYNHSGSSGGYLTLYTAPYKNYDYLTALYKSVTTVKITGTTDGYKIKSHNGYYLNMTSNRDGNNSLNYTVSISTNQTESTATKWIQERNGDEYYLYTFDENTGRKYYLSYNNNNEITLSTYNQISWKLDTDNGYYVTKSGSDYYLKYESNDWVISNKTAYYITTNNHYLKRTNNNLGDTDDYTQATRWIFQNEGTNPSGYIYDESNTSYRLYINNNSLSISTTNGTSWTTTANAIYSGNKYIVYDNSWQLYTANKYYIKYGNNYLSIINGALSNVTDLPDATIWSFSNTSTTNPKGYISTTVNGTTYYLIYNSGLDLSTNNQTNWANDGSGLYFSSGGTNYYIQFKNSTWQASIPTQITGYTLTYTYGWWTTSTYNFSMNGNIVTIFVDSQNRVYFYNNNVVTYLYVTASSNWYGGTSYSVDVTTNSSTDHILKKDGNKISTSYNGTRYLIGEGQPSISSSSNDWTWTSVTQDDLKNTPIASLTAASVPYNTYHHANNLNTTRTISTTNVLTYNTNSTVPSEFNYIPIITDSSNVVKNTNTGYIMSGARSGESGDLTGVDIRVASTTSYNADRISLSYDKNNNVITDLYTYNESGLTVINDETSYKKLAASKTSVTETISQHESALGGIHFIDAQISTDHLVTAPSVMINGNTYTDYQMPEDSIDFRLKTRGYINFFAALYYPGSTSFFSLYEIIRDESTNESIRRIVAINHIKEIYQNNTDKSQPYIYKYENPYNGNYYSNGSNSLPSGYVKIFDTTWIETPTFTDEEYNDAWSSGNGAYYMKKLFYFEIPVNKGEFALGSVHGRDGGYLLYLDIGANAAAVDRTEITQKTVTTTSDYKYVNGIQILDANASTTTINAANSAVAKIPSVAQESPVIGEVTISRTDDTITFSKSLESTYLGQGITGSNLTLTPLTTPTSTVNNVLKYYDYNRAIDTLYVTTVTNNGTSNTGYTVYKILSDSNVFVVDQTASDTEILTKEYGLLKINDSGGGEAVALANVSVNPSSTRADLDYDFYVDTAKKNDIATTVEMNIEAIPDSETTTITNVDSSATVPAQYQFNNGTTLLADDYVIEYGYKLTGDTITVTLNATTQVKIKINVSQNYTFKINGTTATTSSDNIYTQAPTSNG